MAKLIIPKEKIPNVPDHNSKVYVRYRITSEDKNRVSAWTPIFVVDRPQVFIELTETDSSFIFTMI